MSLLLLAVGCVGAPEEPMPLPAIEWDPRTYLCLRTDRPPVIDGRLDDAAWQAAPWTEEFVDIRGGDHPRPRLRTRARMLWDDSRFYVSAMLEEPHVWGTLVERDSVIYHDNDFELFIDPDGDTHEYYELEINALGTVWDLLLEKPYRDGGPAVHEWDIAGLETAVHVDGTINEPTDEDRGWSVEIAIPWAALEEFAHRPVPPRPGDRWRVNFSRVEWRTEVRDGRYEKILDPSTGKPLPEDNWVWSPQGLIAMHYPEMWGFVQFSAGEPYVEEEVEKARWALRRIYYAQRHWQVEHGRFTTDLDALRVPDPALDGYRWPPVLTLVDGGFEAKLEAHDGQTLRIGQDGRVR